MIIKIYVQNYKFDRTKLYDIRKENVDDNIDDKEMEKIFKRKLIKDKNHNRL